VAPMTDTDVFRSILVPLDGSPFGEHALPLATALASTAAATIEAVLVHRPLISDRNLEGLPSIEQLEQQVRAEEQGYLDGIAERLAAAGVQGFVQLLEGPDVGRALLAHAHAAGSDLIVMCTHGRGGFARAWLGSVADEVVRSAEIPVLLVRPGAAPPPADAVAMPRHVLVALASEQEHESALRHVAPLVRLFGGRVTLLRVVPPPIRVGGRTFAADEARYRAVSARANRALEELGARFADAGVEARGRVLSHTQPASAILDFAAADHADLIAIGAGRRSGPQRFILGSVADKVVRGASGPVLLLPAD